MTQYQLLQAAPVLRNLSSYKMPLKKAFGLYKLLKKGDEYSSFFIEKERELVEEYHGTIGDDGQIKFTNTEDLQNFIAKHNELKEIEAEDAEAVVLRAEDLGEQTLSAADLIALEGIVTIEE